MPGVAVLYRVRQLPYPIAAMHRRPTLDGRSGGRMKQMLEIPRLLVWNIAGVVGGGLLVSIALGFHDSPPLVHGQLDHSPAVIFGGVGVLVLLINLWLVVRRPPCLRATADGVWFGGGPLIPWRDIELIYKPPMR